MKHALLSVDDARQRILDAISPIRQQETLLLDAALGRITAVAVRSTLNVPPSANSAMDGYALSGADLPDADTRMLEVTGTAFAGKPYTGVVHTGQCVRIMTGAVLPDGADTVVMQEQVERKGDELRVGVGHVRGQNVRLAGEDIAQGQTALPAGRRITPADLGLLAALGITQIAVLRRPRVAFFSTGDELRAPGEPLGAGEIYDSNRPAVHGMLQRMGVELLDMGTVRDQPDAVKNALQAAASEADVVISTGGASVGDTDFIKQSLDELGEVDFWKIAMKPGKPLAFGRVGTALFFGLPGNPVSTLATFYQFVQPALRRVAGEVIAPPVLLKAVCAEPLKKTPGRTDFQRGIVGMRDDGGLQVHSTGDQGSGILTSMSKANCFIVLPAECGNIEVGDVVDIQLFAGLV